MTGFLLFLALALLCVPLIETLWDPLWVRALGGAAPKGRIRLLAARMIGGLFLAMVLSACLLWNVYHAPRTHPFLSSGIVECLGHDFKHGPGLFTILFLLISSLILVLVLVALFYPLPSFPQGNPRPDLEGLLAERGVTAAVEVVPDEEPACWSELVPYPRVILIGGIEELLPPPELRAVLDHEAGHLSTGDHRSRVWARAYRRLLFFFEGSRAVYDAFVHEQECRADDQVLAWDSTRRTPLKNAIYSLATHEFPAAPAWPAGSPPLGAMGNDAWSVKQRLARLAGKETEEWPRTPQQVWPFVALSLFLFVATSDPGACTLHCLIDSLP